MKDVSLGLRGSTMNINLKVTNPLFVFQSGSKIASTADKYIGDTKWSYSSSHGPGVNTNKCNIFVADIMKEAGGSVPQS